MAHICARTCLAPFGARAQQTCARFVTQGDSPKIVGGARPISLGLKVRVLHREFYRGTSSHANNCIDFLSIKPALSLIVHKTYLRESRSYGGPQVSRHNLPFLAVQLTSSRHNYLSHGTVYFLTTQLTFFTAQLTFSRQKLLFHCKNYFFTGHGTIYFLKAQLTFSRRKSIFAAEVQRTQSPLGRVPRQNRFRFPS